MSILFRILYIFEFLVFGYFLYVSTYNLLLSFFGLFKSGIETTDSDVFNEVLILIPAYKEDSVIFDSVEHALSLNYPNKNFRVLVIADSFKEETIKRLRTFPVDLHIVTLNESTKVKAIQSALKKIRFEYSIMVILDADNIIDKDFLLKANSLFIQGFKIVQGSRVIKNPVNHLAILDDLSEQINTHINRKGVCNAGGSSSISGSGFAVDYQLGTEVFNSLNSIGGFDKEFEIALLRRGYKAIFYDGLFVFDEKVENNSVFKKQRTRWIASQYSFLRKYLKRGFLALFNGNFVLFNSVVLRNIQLPRLLNLGLFSIALMLSLVLQEYFYIKFLYWFILYLLFLISILIAIPKRFYNFRMLLSIMQLPGIFLSMLIIMLNLKGANKRFIHTPHGSGTNSNEK